MNLQTKKLLITGIPGTGKTKIGNYLSENFDFIHVDMEDKDKININKIYINPEIFVNDLVKINKNVVVTWGFVPCEEQIAHVNLFKNKGFKLIWLDGDREAALREFTKRDSQSGEQYLRDQLNAFNIQLDGIEKSNAVARIKPKIYNTFNAEHNFKDLTLISKEIQND